MPGRYERKDHLYKKAKDKGLRSRANFKLEELDAKYKLLAGSERILDLGAWPGGWLQYILKRVGPNARVIGIDLKEIENLQDSRAKTVVGDANDPLIIERALKLAEAPFDLVISDMSPKLTGVRETDQAYSAAMAEIAFSVAKRTLRPGGNFVCKVFKGQDTESVISRIKGKFGKLHRSELDSSRRSSNEFYVVGLGIKA